MGEVEKRLQALGIELPQLNPAQGSYVPFALRKGFVFISGQGPRHVGKLAYKGVVGGDLDVETAQKAARLCALNIAAQLRAACGNDLDRVEQIVRITGYVRCTNDFEGQTAVINAASELLCEIFGAAGPHTRLAIGVNALPSGMPVEMEAIAAVTEA